MGPALYYSILIASRKPGSKVILCTDGLANKGFFSFCFIYFSFDTALFLGIGSLDTDEDQSTYYNELASLATQKGYVCLYFINT